MLLFVAIKDSTASFLVEYGGPDGEMGASMRYLAQRYSMKDKKVIGTLTDIGVSVGKLRIKIVLENGGV